MDYEQARADIEEILKRSLEHEVHAIDPDLARRILAIDLAGLMHDAYLKGRREVLDEWREYDKQHRHS